MSDRPVMDCRGLSCPLPMLKVKQRLDKGDGAFAVLVDEAAAVENITRLLKNRDVPHTVSPGARDCTIEVNN